MGASVLMLRQRHQTSNSFSPEDSRAPLMSAATRYRRAASRPASMPTSWPESGRRIFLAEGPTAFLGTASPLCRKSRATARECRSTRCRISIQNGGSSYVPTGRAEPRSRSRPRSRGVGSTTIRSAATTSTRWGSASFWDKTNLKAVAQPARNAEWGVELYHNYVLFKGLWFTPDIQLYFDPALHPGAGPAAVLTIRTTAFF